MIPWEILGRERAPDGGELVLYRRGGEFVIRVDGRELMSSRAHGSEEEMAALAVGPTMGRVLVGGLGLGYTLRAVLDRVSTEARVVVAEIVAAVVEWNRGPLSHLAGRPLEDARAEVDPRDVATVLRTSPRWDAILLDVDNGPVALTRKANHGLYTPQGIAAAKSALRPGGVLAVWSAAPDKPFVSRLRKAGFTAEAIDVPARGKAGGPMHTIFLGRLGTP